MRLKTYHGASVNAVIQAVRKELGEDALIVSTFENENGVRITAALEREYEEEERLAPTSKTLPFYTGDALCQILKYHGAGDEELNALIKTLTSSPSYKDDRVDILEKAFSFNCVPFEDSIKKMTAPLMIVGSPGSGKTVALAKLTIQALLSGHFVNVITCDTYKAGAVNQLKTYMEAMGIKLNTAKSTEELVKEVNLTPQGSVILIDTPGLNAYDPQEINILAEKIIAIKTSPIWVCAAGEYPPETLERMRIFQGLGCNRMIISKTDMVKRLGGAIAAALNQGISLSGFSNSPLIAEEIISANSASLSEILTKKEESREEENSTQPERERL